MIDWWRSEDNDVDSRSSTPIALPVDEIHRYFLRNAINVSSVQAKNPPREGKLQLLSSSNDLPGQDFGIYLSTKIFIENN